MVIVSEQKLDHFPLIRNHKPIFITSIPTIDLSKPEDFKSLVVKACEELGFFKVTKHSVPSEGIERLEAAALKFFSLEQTKKEQGISADIFQYGRKTIGYNRDVGWLEYLLLEVNSKNKSESKSLLCSATDEYLGFVKKVACQVLELIAEGLNIQPSNIFSKLSMDDDSDAIFRINHYPPCPESQAADSDCYVTGFGEHTDPQMISVLRSNDTSGLEISLKDGSWVSVPADPSSFYILVGDSLQVLTNGRFKSVNHRVLANGFKTRISMVYFGAPALKERVAPLSMLMVDGKESLYRESTWGEYKKFIKTSSLSSNRLFFFKKNSAESRIFPLQSKCHDLKHVEQLKII